MLGFNAFSDPAETLVQTLARQRTTTLYLPFMRPNGVQREVGSNLSRVPAPLDVLLVGENEEGRTSQVLVQDYVEELHLCKDHVFLITAVHNEDHSICFLEIGRPIPTKTLLATEVPDLEGDILMFHLLHVASNRRLSCNNLAQMELVQDRGFPRVVQANYHNLALGAITEHASPEPACPYSHCGQGLSRQPLKPVQVKRQPADPGS
mmetsp:Transcript_105816/g.183981  ORF Transcript_105816/g.183981 Transcript_105816/m.183981 type:complete len:207 (-) Transcript_105816:145-765(-)